MINHFKPASVFGSGTISSAGLSPHKFAAGGDRLVRELHALFGEETLLVPGEETYLAGTLPPESHPQKDRAKLATSLSVAVVCGEKSDHLGALSFVSANKAQQFRGLNPNLAQCLITFNNSRYYIWFRSKAPVCNLQLVNCEVIGTGQVEVVNRASSHMAGYYPTNPPQIIDPGAINWLPEDRKKLAEQPILAEMPFWFRKGKPNLSRIASSIVRQLRLRWDYRNKVLWCERPRECFMMTPGAMKTIIGDSIRPYTKDPQAKVFKTLLTPTMLNRLIQEITLKALAPLKA